MAFRSDLLLARLKAAGKTRKFLTAVTGRSERTVSRWLNDGKPPKREDLLVIARNLDCAPEDFDPDFAEEGQGDVPIHAKVSVASHNAFEMMCSRYDVTQRDIIELAPVLFSIVAAHALRVPAVDEANWQRTERLGLVAARPQSQTEIHPDQQASADKKCFGLSTQDQYAVSRNLFHEAVRRLCLDIGDHVSAENHVRPWPGEAPTAAGFIADVWLMNELTGGDETLIRALTQGGIHIAKFDEDLRRPQKATAANFQRWLRREVESDAAARSKLIEMQREESLVKLQAWRAFYQERYPERAQEYDQIVETYCHEEGWYPPDYTVEQHEKFRAEPYREDRHIDEDKLPEFQKRKTETRDGLRVVHFAEDDPISQRFDELDGHRQAEKSAFEEVRE